MPVEFIFDSVLSNSAIHGQQPNDGVLTLYFAIDPGAGKEFYSLLGAVSVTNRRTFRSDIVTSEKSSCRPKPLADEARRFQRNA